MNRVGECRRCDRERCDQQKQTTPYDFFNTHTPTPLIYPTPCVPRPFSPENNKTRNSNTYHRKRVISRGWQPCRPYFYWLTRTLPQRRIERKRPARMGRGAKKLRLHGPYYFNWASAALILSKLGNWPGSSLDSAYRTTPCVSMTNAERLATPPMPRFFCGRKLSKAMP